MFNMYATKPEIMFQYAYVKHYSASVTDTGMQHFTKQINTLNK